MPRNADDIKDIVGKTITRIEDVNSGEWYDADGFILHFEDGTRLEISANMLQSAGFVTVELKAPQS